MTTDQRESLAMSPLEEGNIGISGVCSRFNSLPGCNVRDVPKIFRIGWAKKSDTITRSSESKP